MCYPERTFFFLDIYNCVIMMFSYVHKKTKASYQQPVQQPQSQPSLFRMQFAYRPLPTYVQKPTQPEPQPQLPKMKWGPPIWRFFHVMAQKIKPEYFDLIIKDFLKFVVLICGTLPCPICSTHASQYMNAINLNNIRTKDDLISLFFNFHNSVNQRKGYPVLQRDQIPNYEAENTIVVLRDFMKAFEDKSRSMKLMADDLARARISNQLRFWLNGNLKYF